MVRPYTDADYESLCAWAQAWGVAPIPKAALPATGFIVESVAVGFLYKTDSCLALIDGYLSNPVVQRSQRDAALDEITRELCNTAKTLGFSHVRCETKLTTVEHRARRHGFVSVGTFTSYVKEL